MAGRCLGRLALGLVVLLGVTACGDGEDDDIVTTSSTDDITTSSTDESDTTTAASGADPVVYGWGVNDPLIPGQYAALAASSSQPPDCEAAEDQAPDGAFWTTVVAVCRALTGQGEWPSATSTPSPPSAPNEFQDCLNQELAAMADGALAWHEAHPGRQPEVVYPSPSALSSCQLRIYEASVYPATGGVVIELLVPGLDDDSQPEVRVDGEPVEIQDDFGGASDGLSNGQVFLPAPIEARSAILEIDTSFGELSTTIELPEVNGNGDETTTTGDPTSDGDTTTTDDPNSDGDTTTTDDPTSDGETTSTTT